MKQHAKKLTYAGVLAAMGILLPMVTAHGFGVPGTVLLPMHIPVLLGGLLCGPLVGGGLGLCLPLLSSLLTGMPTLYPMTIIMTAELTVYGLLSGFLYRKTLFGKWRFGIYPALLLTMIGGRAAYGLLFSLLFFLTGSCRAPALWTAIITGIPGIILQLLFIPAVTAALQKNENGKRQAATRSAVNLIREGRADVMLIRQGVIFRSEAGRGITPLLKLYDEGELKGCIVVDKIVGKAAAMLLAVGGVSACHALTVSESALAFLKQKGIPIAYECCVPHIINRKGDGLCPMEQAVLELTDEKKAPELLHRRLQELQQSRPQ